MSAVRQSMQVFIQAGLSPDARSRVLAQAARDLRDKLQAEGRASTRFRVFADGVPGVEDNAQQAIVYQFNYTAAAVAFAIGFLRARSPSLTGRYRASIMVAVDGRPFPADNFDPNAVPFGAEVLIYSPEPYSRKIDVQRDGSKPLKYSVPPGLFDDTAQAVRRQFNGAVVARRLASVNIPGQYVRKRGATKRSKSDRRRLTGEAVQCPAVQILPVE